MQIINPATEEVIANLKTDDINSLDIKFKRLKENQRTWALTSLKDRIKILKKFAELVKSDVHELANRLSSEMGKPITQAKAEIHGAMSRVQWLTDHAELYLKDETMAETQDFSEKIVHEPLGVICNISAWNFPYNVGVNVFVPALIAGNAVMYKPSEYATLSGLEIAQRLYNAGVPEDIFQVAVGTGEVGAHLLALPFDGYFFTGSYKTGQYIYDQVSPKMVPCNLELGGKDPAYITEDIQNLDEVVKAVAIGAFNNNGQSCCAVERIYVHEKIYDKFVHDFIEHVKSLKVGDPKNENVFFTVISRKQQLDVLEKQVSDAIEKGATVLMGGKKIPGSGYGFEPTILDNVNHNMLVMQEESFGPVKGIMKVKDDEEAITLMQDTEYGLTASVFSNQWERAQRILASIDTGTGYWNCCTRVSAPVPWSGRKHSGIGATLSYMGIRAFTKPKSYQLKKMDKKSN